MSERRQSVLGGALILSVGGILSKIIGALYRIPLTNLLGTAGMGMYQLVFPYYVFLLTVSTTGLPAAISGLIGGQLKRGRSDLAEKTFRAALLSLALIGGLLSVCLYLFAPNLANALEVPELASCFRAISPAILLVCVISAFRGRFSGYANMTPTALSQILEQLVKAGCCLYFAARFMPDVSKAVTYSVASVTLSESVAALYLALRYLAAGEQSGFLAPEALRPRAERTSALLKAVYALSIPVTLSALLTPLTQIADGFFAMKLVNRFASGAGEYGLFSGPVCSLISFPTVFAQSIGLALIPGIAGKDNPQREIAAAFKLTLFIAVPCTLFLILFAQPLTDVLYRGLSAADRLHVADLLRVYALAVIGLSLMQTSVSVLVACGRAKVCAYFMVIAAVVKVALSATLMRIPGIGIFGAAISGTVCFLLAGILDLGYIIREKTIGFTFRGEYAAKPVFYTSGVGVIWGLVHFLPLSGSLRLGVACLLALTWYVLLFLKSPFFAEEKSMLIGRRHASHHRPRQRGARPEPGGASNHRGR